MDTSNIVVFVVILVIFALVMVSVVNYFIPFYKKMELQSIGQEFFNVMEVRSGLTVGERNEIETKLISKGFQNIVINYSQQGTVPYGSSLVLDIDAEYDIKRFAVFSNADLTMHIDFESEVTNRRIEE